MNGYLSQVFVQLDELKGNGDEREWKETARWIKYEEDVQEGTDRWGRPHVASLSFHSLLNVRRSLESGTFFKHFFCFFNRPLRAVST